VSTVFFRPADVCAVGLFVFDWFKSIPSFFPSPTCTVVVVDFCDVVLDHCACLSRGCFWVCSGEFVERNL